MKFYKQKEPNFARAVFQIIPKEQKLAKRYFKDFTYNTFSIGRAGTYRYEVDIDDCIWQSLQIKSILDDASWNGPIVGDEFK